MTTGLAIQLDPVPGETSPLADITGGGVGALFRFIGGGPGRLANGAKDAMTGRMDIEMQRVVVIAPNARPGRAAAKGQR